MGLYQCLACECKYDNSELFCPVCGAQQISNRRELRMGKPPKIHLIECARCKGSGCYYNGMKLEECPECNGKRFKNPVPCPDCLGFGIHKNGNTCIHCRGTGEYWLH